MNSSLKVVGAHHSLEPQMVLLSSVLLYASTSVLKVGKLHLVQSLFHSTRGSAMHALNIPTTRALALVSLPALPVTREQTESASVVTRVAPSFIRIGNFEALNGPANMFFFGGGQQKADLEALRILGEYVAKDVLKLDIKEGEAWGEKLVLDVATRNAKMVGGWQAYGFMHGVINTDK